MALIVAATRHAVGCQQAFCIVFPCAVLLQGEPVGLVQKKGHRVAVLGQATQVALMERLVDILLGI